ncbi:polycystin-2-like protein 1 [Eurosta solidaginis]|uniref:polycystin-2-like protein 1 n=1 Tax=Eurosta solidaginis TaxID=178769 RepID=UPI003531145D
MDFQRSIKYDSASNIKKSLLSILLYAIFLVVTTMVAVASRHHYLYYFNHAIKHHFMIYERHLTNHEWWQELREIYVPEVLESSKANEEHKAEEADREENEDENKNQTNTQSTKDELTILHENYLLGTPRLRQLRVEKEDCSVDRGFMASFNNTCYAVYTIWSHKTDGKHEESEYKSAHNLGTKPIDARMHTYWGGGFLENLNRKFERSVIIVKELEARNWLDRGTRLMVFEFIVFNSNTDLFNNVKILGEVPVTGGVIISLQANVIQKYALWTGSVWIILAAIIFYLISVYYIFKEVRATLREGWKKIVNYWKLVDSVILILIVLSFIYNIFHPVYLHYYLKGALEKKSEYHSLDFICWFNRHYMNLMAVLAFLVWIKIFQLFNFNKTALRLKATFLRCYTDLLNFVGIFLILFFSYAILGMILFGHAHADFYSFPIAFWSVMRMVLTDFDYAGVEKANTIFAPLYFLSFIIVISFILINMFLAIIYDTFREVKKVDMQPDKQLHDFFDRYWDKGKISVRMALNKIGLFKPTQPSKRDEPLREVVSDNEPPFPPTPKPERKVKVPKNEILDNFFETVRNKRDAEQVEILSQHISALEEILDKMSDDLRRLEAESPDPSTQPARPWYSRAPQRSKVFVKRHK